MMSDETAAAPVEVYQNIFLTIAVLNNHYLLTKYHLKARTQV